MKYESIDAEKLHRCRTQAKVHLEAQDLLHRLRKKASSNCFTLYSASRKKKYRLIIIILFQVKVCASTIMSAVFDEREAFLRNPFLKREYGDFTPFYVVIAICTVFGFFLLFLNITLCCSRYRDYWCDSNTGNRWILPIWTKTPHQQPPLDLTELPEEFIPQPQPYYSYPENYSDFEPPLQQQEEYFVLQTHHKKSRESDL